MPAGCVNCASCQAKAPKVTFEDDVIDKLRDMMDKVFHNMSMRVVIETPKPEEDSAVAETVASLKEFWNLHFATQ